MRAHALAGRPPAGYTPRFPRLPMRPWLVLLVAALPACAGKTPAPRPAVKEALAPAPPGTFLPVAGPGETLTEYDLNHDGKTDVWKITRRTAEGKEVLVRRARDLNDDGKIDVWEEYDAAGELVKQTLDLDFDGKPDLVLHFEK